jgi:hypothetical protein
MAIKIRPLAEIKSKLLRPATTSHFECNFVIPSGPRGDGKGGVAQFLKNRQITFDKDIINLSCCEASLPGSTLQTATLTDSYTGVTENYAYRRAYDNRADFSFYVDYNPSKTAYSVIEVFENWIAYAAGENQERAQKNSNYFYRVNFPSLYMTSELNIKKFEKDYSKYLQYTFINAFPLSIASMPVSYEGSQVLKCTVSFSYQRYVIENNVGPGLPKPPKPPTPAPQTPPTTTSDLDFIFPQFY